MRVLVLCHGLLYGGAQVSTVEFLRLIKDNLSVHVVMCNGASPDFVQDIEALGLEVSRIPYRMVSNYPVMDIKAVASLVKEADAIWISDEEYLAAPKVKRIKNVSIVAHLHSYALICPWWGTLYGFREVCIEKCSSWRITRCKQGINLELSRVGLLSGVRAGLYCLLDFAKGPVDYARWRQLMRGVLDSIDGYVAVSNALWRIHTSHVPELAEKPHAIVYNPVTEPLRYIRPTPGEPYGNYILYASGSNPVKGPYLLLEAWSEVSKEYRDLKLYMVGCKNSWVEGLAKKKSLKNVVFTEKLPPNDYYYLMYKAKAVVMSSIWPEPFGRIPVEANRLGVLAVVSDRGGLPEVVVSGVTGFIAKAGDISDLVNNIQKALSTKSTRDHIAERSLAKINFREPVTKLVKLFESST